MKAALRELIAPASNQLLAIHIVREYLQARILQSLQRAGAMQTLAFHGGTSLRFLYHIPRYSEDLDFALERAADAYNFRAYLGQIERDFAAEAYTLDVRLNDKQIVHKAFIRFRGLLYELGLSAHETEVLSIKIEVDTRPPGQARLLTTSLYRYVPLNLQHHDPATLLAGKLHALLQRDYLKGRDVYDLWWYLTQPEWPEPNLAHLEQNLQQSRWDGAPVSAANWRAIVGERLRPASWSLIRADVEPFIMTADGLQDFTWERLLDLLA